MVVEQVMLSIYGKVDANGNFNWKDALIDAGIMAALTFFTALGGLGATGDIALREILAAGVAGATEFFMVLAIKRGLKKERGG